MKLDYPDFGTLFPLHVRFNAKILLFITFYIAFYMTVFVTDGLALRIVKSIVILSTHRSYKIIHAVLGGNGGFSQSMAE